MEATQHQILSSQLLAVPYEQKWELLKPTIEQLYVHEQLKLSEVINTIKDRHGFDAAEPHYKYQIKKWKLKKNTSTVKKAAVYRVIKSRAQVGKGSVITRGGQQIDPKNLRRYLKAESRKAITLQPDAGRAAKDGIWPSGHVASFGNCIFMKWNMPYGVLRSSATHAVNHPSPLSDIHVATPPSNHGTPPSMDVAIKTMTTIDRARLFVEGKHDDLLRSLGGKQRVTMSTWMYQFWLFSFKTAKHWGRGPQDWTADMLAFDNFHQRKTISGSSPNTPGGSVATPISQPTPKDDEMVDSNTKVAPRPSSLCRWSIHCNPIGYQSVPSPPRSPAKDVDIDDEDSWPTWSDNRNVDNFTEKLSNNLESNKFSNIGHSDLPIASGHIARAARGSPKELADEALGFSIMSRNEDLATQLLKGKVDLRDTAIHPLHLAASYVDGSRSCCSMLALIHNNQPFSLRRLYINDLGHTVLDQLMMAILKAHTSCLPSVVDDIFRQSKRFEGEDVDICGRYDADSDCVRALLANGSSDIPFGWKHLFCHTSIQTICRCIGNLFGPWWRADVNTPSGLFVKRCQGCGLKLQLRPLHTLILVALHLSLSGCNDENLFGIVACSLCLLSNGANTLLKAQVSLLALLGNEDTDGCSHEEMDPVELAEKVQSELSSTWSCELNTGWQIISKVLRYSQVEWRGRASQKRRREDHVYEVDMFYDFDGDDESDDGAGPSNHDLPYECPVDVDHENFFGRSKRLATLWGAVQTELLTYRRQEEGDPWLSENFNMTDLNESLINGGELAIPLVQNKMMKAFCDCGLFYDAAPAGPTVEDAAAYYFSNLEDWNRSTFLSNDDDRGEYWYE